MKVFNHLILNYKIWLSSEHDEGLLGDGKWKILKAINETGSLTAACEKLDITYRRTWNDLKEIEDKLGFPLLEKSRGGKDGGSTRLTQEGIKLVQEFDALHSRIDKVMQDNFHIMLNNLRKE